MIFWAYWKSFFNVKFLIFIVAYYHWRVLVISYWLRGAADSLIACARAFLNSFLLYSLPLNFIKTLKRTLLWTCWLIGIMFYTCIVKKIIGKKRIEDCRDSWSNSNGILKENGVNLRIYMADLFRESALILWPRKLFPCKLPSSLLIFKLCALNNWWLSFVYILFLVHAGSLL